jgi:hypothetical protein
VKTVAFNKPRTASSVDRWVGDVALEQKPAKPVQMKRFTLDVPLELHTRIKTQCAARGVKMADILREVLEREFPQPSP